MVIKRKNDNLYLSELSEKGHFSFGPVKSEINMNNIDERKTHEFEFVNIIQKETSLLEDTSFILAIDGLKMYIFKRFTINHYTYYMTVDIPGEQSKEFWNRLLMIEDDECREIFYMESNNFTFITYRKILAVMLKYYELLDRGEKPYKEARIKSKNGKVRDIIVPHLEIKAELRNLNESFQKIFDYRNESFQVAYKKGKNVLSNAIIHKDNPYIFKLDLKNFFPSCSKEIVVKKTYPLFSNSFNKDVLIDEFMKTILYDDALFIGSPISGTLANFCFSEAAAMIKNITGKKNVKFSIYADDMTFSSERFLPEAYVNGVVDYVFKELELENNFHLNTKKSIGQSKERRHITGVSFNDKSEPVSSRAISRYIRTGLHRSEIGGSIDKPILKGKIQYALSIEGFNGKVSKMLRDHEAIVKKEKFLSKKQEEKIFAK